MKVMQMLSVRCIELASDTPDHTVMEIKPLSSQDIICTHKEYYMHIAIANNTFNYPHCYITSLSKLAMYAHCNKISCRIIIPVTE